MKVCCDWWLEGLNGRRVWRTEWIEGTDGCLGGWGGGMEAGMGGRQRRMESVDIKTSTYLFICSAYYSALPTYSSTQADGVQACMIAMVSALAAGSEGMLKLASKRISQSREREVGAGKIPGLYTKPMNKQLYPI